MNARDRAVERLADAMFGLVVDLGGQCSTSANGQLDCARAVLRECGLVVADPMLVERVRRAERHSIEHDYASDAQEPPCTCNDHSLAINALAGDVLAQVPE